MYHRKNMVDEFERQKEGTKKKNECKRMKGSLCALCVLVPEGRMGVKIAGS